MFYREKRGCRLLFQAKITRCGERYGDKRKYSQAKSVV